MSPFNRIPGPPTLKSPGSACRNCGAGRPRDYGAARHMDLARFGLSRRPFRPNPDPAGYVPREATEAALAALRHALDRRESLALLDGPGGVGKTVVALKFLETLDANAQRVFVPAARMRTPAELFQTLLFDDDEPYAGRSEHELRLAVTDRLLKTIARGPTVLVLDEAQHLGDDALEELRLLGNLAGRHGSALFALLVAQPELRERLARSATGVAHRLGTRLALPPMTEAESAEYLAGQLARGGDESAKAFTPEALRVLAASCGGVPRVLNRAATAALDAAGDADAPSADAEVVFDALAGLGVEAREPGDELPEVGAAAGARRRSA